MFGIDFGGVNNLSAGALLVAGGISLIFAVVFIVAYVKIITRAGYSGWWVLILIVPIVNVVMILVFAFKRWPVQDELDRYRHAPTGGHNAGGYNSGGYGSQQY